MNNLYTIYMHKFPNEKVYIGITRREVQVRWGVNGYHYRNNEVMWNDILKYGWNNIEHVILEENVPLEEISQKERDYIKKFDSTNKEKGYNKQLGGLFGQSSLFDEMDIVEMYEDGADLQTIAKYSGCCTRTASEILHKHGIDSKELIKRGRKTTADKIRKLTASEEERLLKMFNDSKMTVKDIERSTDYSYSTLQKFFQKHIDNNTLMNRQMAIPFSEQEQIKSYILQGKTYKEIGILYNCSADAIKSFTIRFLPELLQKVQENRYKKIGQASCRAVKQYSMDNVYIATYPSITEANIAMKKEQGHTGHISQVCSGQRNSACGYKWKYAD